MVDYILRVLSGVPVKVEHGVYKAAKLGELIRRVKYGGYPLRQQTVGAEAGKLYVGDAYIHKISVVCRGVFRVKVAPVADDDAAGTEEIMVVVIRIVIKAVCYHGYFQIVVLVHYPGRAEGVGKGILPDV